VPHPSEMNDEIPSGWWAEEYQRGNKELLIIHKGADPRGSIEVDTYEEKAAWLKILDQLNSMLRLS